MVQTYFIVQLIYWQKKPQKQSDHQNNLKKENNENGATVIFAFSQQAPKLLTRGTKKSGQKIFHLNTKQIFK